MDFMPLVREAALLNIVLQDKKKGQVKKCKKEEPHCCDSKGEKVYEKVFLSLNNLSISFTCVETVI